MGFEPEVAGEEGWKAHEVHTLDFYEVSFN